MSSTSNEAAGKPRFDIGGVLGHSWTLFRANWIPFSLLSLVVYGIFYSIWAYAITAAEREMANFATNPDDLSGFGTFFLVFFGGMMALMVTYGIVTAGVTWGAREQMEERPASFGAMLGVGMRLVVPLIAIGFLIWLGIAGGMILLIVPGLILLVRWSIALPVLVIERPARWTHAMKRSAELTKGYRWQVFGLIVILYVISTIGNTLITGTLGYYDPNDPFGINAPAIMSPAEIIVGAIYSSLFVAFASVMFAAMYDHLLNLKEGSGLTAIARVFD